MGYHDRCFDDVTYLESKDPYHNNKRDILTEKAIKRYAETNPEYEKVLNKYYMPDKKLPRSTIKETNDKKSKSTEVKMSNYTARLDSNSSERLCANCKQIINASKRKNTESKVVKNDDDSSLIYWKTKIDDNHPPVFPPKYPNECTSLILPAMFTEEEKRYYQSKQPKYPPAEKISSIIEINSPIRSKPTCPYNIITGEELYETI
ncbi:hypothetical protein BCR36DRAFT_416666 [Piromyces finnis]|uniref:Uncharacterized protein n=1 Tax=Piromyces finnis TaxID=1754191 RepID=A0A1Y1UUJ4_9FUNG|nr:hypothetical protein BCR36DRAFT_416666 [Piromyces finnis]|eukprot:ORX41674.1 hypothetical protein BCR36DRAFT_416666 [Piromyces finnis]